MVLLLACLSPDASETALVPHEELPSASQGDGDDEHVEPTGQPTALSIEDFFEDWPGDPPEDPPEDEPQECVRAQDFPVHPWDLNVVVLGDLGGPQAPYGSDFQGAAAVVGGAWMQGFSLNDIGLGGSPMALYAGGEVHIGGSISGSVEAGSLSLDGASVDGDVVLAGDLTGQGSISGSATLAGEDLSGEQLSVLGGVYSAAFQPSLDLDALALWFEDQSTALAALPPTNEVDEIWGELVITTHPGLNVVELDADALDAAWGLRVVGNEDLVVNLVGDEVHLDAMVWSHGGSLLLNAPTAHSVHLSGGDHRVALLAPWAEVTFPSGLLTGNLVAASLEGGGQVNEAPYTGPEQDCLEDGGPGGGPQ